MIETNFLTGKLIISPPRNNDGHFSKSVVLIAQHSENGAWGIVLNKLSKTFSMQTIMSAVGIDCAYDESIYIGGPVEPTRVQVVHTLDWKGSGTLKITDNIGITGDTSVLAAIAGGEGPKFFRAGIGLSVWSAGQLEGELSGLTPWTKIHQWLTTDATFELCLTGGGEEQWQRAINKCVNERIATLF